MGVVYLTGAGPGDIELLTLKALRVIKAADVIIYDRLANPDILKEAKQSCQFVYVGKEDGRHILPQDEINQTIYEHALVSDVVVRLKGGDPFVFGRGSEEGIFLRKKGVRFEAIPGVTSAVGVPEYAGIPVTSRGISSSFRVVTGHEASDKKHSHIKWHTFIDDDTIVFLMGLHNIKQICKKLVQAGKDPACPVAVISKGTTKEQRCIVFTLGDLPDEVQALPTPALIIIGEVVKLRDSLNWFENA